MMRRLRSWLVALEVVVYEEEGECRRLKRAGESRGGESEAMEVEDVESQGGESQRRLRAQLRESRGGES